MRKLRPLTSYLKAPPVASSEARSSCIDLFNATNGQLRATIQPPTPSQITQAIQDASTAQQQWYHDYTPSQRSQILQRASTILSSESPISMSKTMETIAMAEVHDTGRTISEITSYDLPAASHTLSYYAHLPSTHNAGLNSFHVPNDNSHAYVTREPLGVTLAIGAWNYPLMNAVQKSAPALAFGNAVLYKPSELTPLSALMLAEDVYEIAGLPKGLFQVLLGDASVGKALLLGKGCEDDCDHRVQRGGGRQESIVPRNSFIQKVSFTGSVDSGKEVYQAAVASSSPTSTSNMSPFPKVTLELGGKSPLIIMKDATISSAVQGTINANWYSNGQVCSNGTRVYVHESIHDQFVHALIEKTKEMVIGHPMEKETEIGPMVSKQHMDRVLRYIDIGKNIDGATLAYGGERLGHNRNVDDDGAHQHHPLQEGFYVSPAIFTNCTEDMTIVQEEVFGMLMSILKFTSEEEVVSRANSTQFGLAAGIFTNHLSTAHRMARHLKAGTVWINNYNLGPVELPWGGFGQSGLGRENGSYDAVFEWTASKSVHVELENI